MLQFDIWQLAVRHFLPKLFTVDYLKCVLLNCWDQTSQDTVNAVTDQLLKYWPWWLGHRMDMLNVASTRIFTILTLIVNLKWYACQKWTSLLKLVVILAHCYYTKTAQRMLKYSDIQTPVLLWTKYWTIWYIECYSMSTYTGVSNFQKTVRFFGPQCIIVYPKANWVGLSYRTNRQWASNTEWSHSRRLA